jgi:hypothetical protein
MPVTLLSPAAGCGLLILSAWSVRLVRLGKLEHRRRILPACWVVAFSAGLLATGLPTLHEGKGTHRQAGLAIRSSAGEKYVLSHNRWVPFFAGAPAIQFRARAGMPSLLRPEHLRSVEDLLSRARPVHGRRYHFVAIGERLKSASPNPHILEQIRARPDRFEQICVAGAETGQKVWVFRIRWPP